MAEQIREPSAPVVSVIIPLWNRAHLIADCLASIGGGARTDYEVIVVDDGSSDDSVAVARATIDRLGLGDRAQVIVQENGGPGAARNTAAAAARGTWLACLDSDDFWFPWTLDHLISVLAEHPETDVLFMKAAYLRGRDRLDTVTRGEPETVFYRGFLDAFLAESTSIYFGTDIFVCRKATFDEVGGFAPGLRMAEDMDMFLKLPLDCRLTLIRAPFMVAHMNTEGSLTKSYASAYQGLMHLRDSERRGRYPGGSGKVAKRNIFLARVTQFTIMNGWLNKRYGQSYGLFLRSAWLLANNRCRMFILRYHRRILGDAAAGLVKGRSRG